MKYPKVLIVSSEDIFKCDTSSTFTVRSFFEGWPTERFKQIVCGEGQSDETTLVLTNKDRLFCGLVSRKKKQSVSIQRNETQFYKQRRSLKQFIRQFIINIYVLLPYLYSKRVRVFVDDFNPDIIYSPTMNITIIQFVYKISKRKRIPFILHFFDDGLNMVFKDYSLLRKYALQVIKRAFNQAPIVLCIGDLMCREYEKRYGYQKFLPLMHSVHPILKQIEPNHTNKTLLYAGSLYLGRYKTLVELSKTIAAYNDSSIELVIYTNKQAWDELHDYFREFPFVRYGGFVSQEELTNEIAKAYGLVFVESFDKEMLSYTRFSMSTKIPEYLSSGNPILAIGNEEQSSIAYLKEHNAAYVVTSTGLISNIMKSFLERVGWTNMSENAKSLFENNHSRNSQKERFRQIVVNSLMN